MTFAEYRNYYSSLSYGENMGLGASIWQDKVALVTGGSSGIGLALARQLAEGGAQVWIMARRQEQLNAAVNEICCKDGQRCGAVRADVSTWEQVQDAVERVRQEAGPPDLVINSAGLTRPGYFQELDLEVFHELMEVNYFGTLYVTRAVLPEMLARRSGYIVNISSLAGHLAFYGYTAYSPSKYAVRGFTDALRSEVKPFGVHLSIVFPPDTDTPQLAYDKQYQPPEAAEVISMAGVMSPDRVAEIILDGVAKRRYIINPGLEAKFWYRIIALSYVFDITYPILDWLLHRARRKLKASS